MHLARLNQGLGSVESGVAREIKINVKEKVIAVSSVGLPTGFEVRGDNFALPAVLVEIVFNGRRLSRVTAVIFKIQ
jgi:hypothetical protein